MGDPWEDLNAPEETFEQRIHLFSVKHAKKQQAYQTEIFPKAL